MNLHTTLLAPWRASRPATAWVALALAGVTALAAAAFAAYSHKPDPWLGSAFIVGLGEACLWAFFLSNAVLLAIDARQLRLPGVQRRVTVAVVLYGLLGVGLPTAILSALGGTPEQIATLITLLCLSGLAFALLPQYLGVLVYLLPIVLQNLPSGFHLPGPESAGFFGWALPAVLGLLLITFASWRRLVRADSPYKPGLGQPMVMQFRFAARRTSWGGWGWGTAAAAADSTHAIRAQPAWMQREVDVRKGGPGRTVSSLRVMLGGPFMPLTAMSWLRQAALVLVPVLLFTVLLSWQDLRRHHGPMLAAVWHGFEPSILVLFGGLGSMMLAFFCLTQLGRSWRKANAELPLLALLPGLAGGRQGTRDLLWASLMPPLRLQLALLIAVLMVCLAFHLGVQATMLVLLSQLGSIGFVVAFTLAIIGGYSFRPWMIFASGMLGCTLINVSMLTPTLTDVSQISLHVISLRSFLLLAWGVLGLYLLWLGRRGWLSLQQLAHPFLPH